MPRDVLSRTVRFAALSTLVALACAIAACSKTEAPRYRSFATPEDAVRALNDAVAKGNVDEVLALFGPDGRELVNSSEPVVARHNREVYNVAVKEGWRLVDVAAHKELVIGKEGWPFPVPLVKDEAGWRFDTAAGKEEVLARRIGRNELRAIQVCYAYVAAQRRYAQEAHDGKPAGLYAQTFRSDPGRHNGLYWPVKRGQKRSPLGDLLGSAADDRAAGSPAAPFHGYYFRILTEQGDTARGGARSYIDKSGMAGGFALIAWPAQYDVTGVMTFIVNQDGVVHEQDLGPQTEAAVKALTRYDPDTAWSAVN
jgi:hypothetical protein